MKFKILFYLILLTLVASLIPAVHAQTFSVLHSFTGIGPEGGGPATGVAIRGTALYGTTANYCGTVYQLTHSGSSWLFSTLTTLPHNCTPTATVTFGPDGHLYGASEYGGPGYGTVFKLTPPVGICKTAACYWTITDVHDFYPDSDGYDLRGDLAWDQQGNIYGATTYGGLPHGDGAGIVYELTPSGNGYTETILYVFTTFGGLDGCIPQGVVVDNKGNVFGLAWAGLYGYGVVFELTYIPGVGWTEKSLYDFQGADDGQIASGAPILDSAGNLYGTAGGGSNGGGTVFELSPSGNTWTFKVLYSFSGCGSPGPLTMDGAGNLYGTTVCGGTYNNGSVFKLTNTLNGWVYSSLHDFTGGSDGSGPQGSVSIDTDGTFYGTTKGGGDHGAGTVWMIKP